MLRKRSQCTVVRRARWPAGRFSVTDVALLCPPASPPGVQPGQPGRGVQVAAVAAQVPDALHCCLPRQGRAPSLRSVAACSPQRGWVAALPLAVLRLPPAPASNKSGQSPPAPPPLPTHAQTGYLIGSIEGRVAVHHVEDNLQSKNFTFKCHRCVAAAGWGPKGAVQHRQLSKWKHARGFTLRLQCLPPAAGPV